MLTVRGRFASATIFANNIEPEAYKQILNVCNQEFAAGSRIAIMPDVHAGVGCTIGTTMTINGKVVPNLVGVDIGCGMLVSVLEEGQLDLDRLDQAIHQLVPSGMEVRDAPHKYANRVNLEALKCKKHVDLERARLSIGTLGGGNHFIEVNKSQSGELLLVIHSGSRYLGKQVAKYYQDQAYKSLASQKSERTELIKRLKALGREKEIQKYLDQLKPAVKVSKDLAYLEGEGFQDYLHDLKIVQEFASYNRLAMADTIIESLGLTLKERFATIHNYIDLDAMILRKGAISAQRGEKVIIPLNMRDGSIIAIGKGNPEWNYSAPHGAGRLMSRAKAKELISVDAFKRQMTGIYSSTVGEETVDEAPEAYKPMDEIIANVKDAVEIIEIVRPIYNYKASESIKAQETAEIKAKTGLRL